MIEIQPSKMKFDEVEFNEFQKSLGVTFPKDYIKFLEETDGGFPERNKVELPNKEIKSISVTEFFGVNNENINNLKYQHEIYKDRIPTGYIPISRVEGGNIICLNIEDESIYLWDHDNELLLENTKKSSV